MPWHLANAQSAADSAAPKETTAKDKAPAAAPAEEKLPAVPVPEFPRAQSKLDDLKASLDQIETTLRNRNLPDSTLTDLRDQIAKTQTDARELIAAVTSRLEAANSRATQLAPDPKVTAPQSDDVKLERAKLLAEVTARQSLIQQAKLINVRAQQALDTISDRRRTRFAETVLLRSESLINPTFWIDAAAAVPTAGARLLDLMSASAAQLASQPLRAAAGIAIVVALLLGFFLSPAQRWLSRWTFRNPETARPSDLRKTSAAVAIIVAGTVIPGIALFVLYQANQALRVLPDDVDPILRVVFPGIVFAIFFSKLTTAVLAPGLPSWRIVNVTNSVADGLTPAAKLLAAIIAFGVVLDAVNVAIRAPLLLTVAGHGVVAIAKALVFFAAIRIAAREKTKEEEADEAGAAPPSTWSLLIPFGWVTTVVALLAPLIGYVALARFLSIELVVIVAVLMSAKLLTQFADAIISMTFAYNGAIGRFLRLTAGLRGGAVRQLATILAGVTQLAIIGLAVFIILTTWGLRSDDLVGSVSSAFFGFTIGGLTISPSAILLGLVVLAIGIAATRAIQHWLEGRFLPETNLDIGLRSSIRTGTGYVGIILAVIFAMSFLGINLQNIAIVAGALSVGIGFGLQSIINNFVSGLILLVERPIKVGDRIEVGARMGVVKRINVRATEIVTYDNVSVIVPNAELISGQVVNWMHDTFSARLTVAVGVGYDSDPDKVIEMLLDIVANNPRVLTAPAPFAILENLGADALEFKVFFHVGNIGTDAGVANEVRLEALKRCRAEGIEIPFAQRDLHLRDMDRIEAALRGVSRGRENGASSGSDSSPPDGKSP